tara:strand:- start:147 stop:833 length:687 start_codon:yes stop_codon:yes gene_type:complete
MKLLPSSLIGWTYLIFGTAGLIINAPAYEMNLTDITLRIIFVYGIFLIITNVFNTKKPKISVPVNNKKINNKEINTLKEKLNQLNEEDELNSLRDELNKKRLERGLISLIEYEILKENIKNKKIDYKDTKAIYFETINDKKIAQNERLFLTIIFSIITFLLFYFGISGDFWIGGILGVISGSLMIYYFIEINKRIKYLETEINRLFTIKETSLKELKKLNKYFNQQTI